MPAPAGKDAGPKVWLCHIEVRGRRQAVIGARSSGRNVCGRPREGERKEAEKGDAWKLFLNVMNFLSPAKVGTFAHELALEVGVLPATRRFPSLNRVRAPERGEQVAQRRVPELRTRKLRKRVLELG